MTSNAPREQWGSGDAYERWIGRWSRLVAPPFLDWLAVGPGADWADVGCGTGALAQAILDHCEPRGVTGCDKSSAYVGHARAAVPDPRAGFEAADALALPWADGRFDAAVSALVLNFVPDPPRMAREMARITRPGGTVAAYVWHYAGGMQMMRHFWDVAVELRPSDSAADQAERFPICEPDALTRCFAEAGLRDVQVRAIEIPMVFRDFDDYWQPFLGRQGSAPTYLASLPQVDQVAIRERLRERLQPAADGSITLDGRAWAVRGAA